jgi:hypothetical protein
MNGILYRIFNITNGKSYIGKTYSGFYTRLREHIADKDRYKNRPLYRAFNKHGLEGFSAEILGEYPQGILEDKEIEAILLYQSYSKGYNATAGGDGKRYIDVTKSQLQAEYDKRHTIIDVAKHFGIDECYCGKLFKRYNIALKSSQEVAENRQKNISIIGTNKVFISTRKCAEWLLDEGIVTESTKIDSIEKSISKVCRGVRSRYKGYVFQYS